MLRYKILGGISVGVLLAGGVLLLAGKEAMIEPIITESDVADLGLATDAGHTIHVVGVARPPVKTVVDSEIGRAVIVDASVVSREMLCTVVFEAAEFKGRPNVVGMDDCWGPAMDPVKVPDSWDAIRKTWIWYEALRGQCCVDATAMSGYLASSMPELLLLSAETKKRILRVEGICLDKDSRPVSCTVPIGDPRALSNVPIRFPIALAGRYDLKILDTTNAGLVEPRIKLIAEPIPEEP